MYKLYKYRSVWHICIYTDTDIDIDIGSPAPPKIHIILFHTTFGRLHISAQESHMGVSEN